MWSLMKKIVAYRIGQKVAKGVARKVGLKKMAPVLGVYGGLKSVWKHS